MPAPKAIGTYPVSENILLSGNPYQTGGIHLVSVGRLNRQKGYDLLIRAVSDACHEVAGHQDVPLYGPCRPVRLFVQV